MSDMGKLVAAQARRNAEQQTTERNLSRYRIVVRTVRVNGSTGFGVVRVSSTGSVTHLAMTWSSREDAEAVATALNLAARSER